MLQACNLPASLAVSAAKRMYSPSPVPRRQPSRPIPMPMQPSIAFQQNCCTAGTPISHHAEHAHTSPSSDSNPHPHGEQDEKASVRPSLHNKCSFKPPQPASIGPPPACKIARCLACPSTRRTSTAFTTSSPTLEIALTARKEVIMVPIGWRPGREGGRCAV
jgi:hypothetical protein